MKAIRVQRFGPPDVMQLQTVADPAPGPGQVVVRLHAAGVNPVETYVRSGHYAVLPALPYTPGSDGAGLIEAVGPGVPDLRVGDRVYVAGSLTGTYAERTCCDARHVHPLPESLSFPQGAAIGVPYATAGRALLTRARARPGETVLVHGASGGVGTAAVQFAARAGLTILATAGSERGRQLAREQGAHHVLDHKPPEHFQQVVDLTAGRGPDVILEMLANVNLGRDLQIVAKFGRIVVVGCRGTVEINPRAAMMRDAAVLGMTLMNAAPAELADLHAAIGAGLRDGTLRPVVGAELPLAEAPRAHHDVIEQPACGKIVLVP